MTIDKAKLKALAEAATPGERTAEKCAAGIPHVITEEWDIAEVHVTTGTNPMADAEFMAAASPATVLALLAEIERLSQSPAHQAVNAIASAAVSHLASEAKGCFEKGLLETIDQLTAEKEALRKDAERYRWLRKPWQEQRQVKAWTSLEVMDENIDAAMAKEAAHG